MAADEKMNRAPALEIGGAVLRFRVVFVSASDHGHGGGDETTLYDGYDLQEAVDVARKPVQWGSVHIELEGWR